MESKWKEIAMEQFEKERGSLDLSWREIRDSDISDIIEVCMEVHNQIKELNLRSNSIGATNFPYLTKLLLDKNKIGTEGVKYLSAGNFCNLTVLYLSKNINIQPIIKLEKKGKALISCQLFAIFSEQYQIAKQNKPPIIIRAKEYSNKILPRPIFIF